MVIIEQPNGFDFLDQHVLQVHLPNQQGIVFNPDGTFTLQEVLDANAECDTTLTGWFKANAQEPEGSEILNLLYQDYPTRMVWHKTKDNAWWVKREKGFGPDQDRSTGGQCQQPVGGLPLSLSSVEVQVPYNVESIASVKAVKYIYKYVHKGQTP